MVMSDIKNIVNDILDSYDDAKVLNHLEIVNMPDKEVILQLLEQLIAIAYYGYNRNRKYKVFDAKTNLSVVIEDSIYRLQKQLTLVLPYAEKSQLTNDEIEEKASTLTMAFFKRIPAIRELLEQDVTAILEGDPAASNKDEIIFSYPGFYAITVYRIAHELFDLGVPMIPRIMSETAHSKTGIDIHPGATIGKRFFIDHGTGIVIGETTIIGENVKLYQGVTLGALSTSGGQLLKGVKRHPTIEDGVTIYANASVLGDITIGADSVIGGNVFITRSIPAGTKVRVKGQELHYKFKDVEEAGTWEI